MVVLISAATNYFYNVWDTNYMRHSVVHMQGVHAVVLAAICVFEILWQHVSYLIEEEEDCMKASA